MANVADLFKSCSLTPSGRALLLEDEIEILTADQVSLLDGYKNYVQSDSLLVVTDRRMILIVSASQGSSMHLKSIGSFCTTGFLGTSKKVMIDTTYGIRFHLRFLGEGKDLFMKCINKYLQKQKLLTSNPPSIPSQFAPSQQREAQHTDSQEAESEPAFAFSSNNAGISGILRRQEHERSSVDSLQKEALSDLSNLMKNAADVVLILDKYTAAIERETASADSSASELGEISEIEDILLNIGIIVPITRSSVGKLYYEQLVKENKLIYTYIHALVMLGYHHRWTLCHPRGGR